jgi:hypothetical protein
MPVKRLGGVIARSKRYVSRCCVSSLRCLIVVGESWARGVVHGRYAGGMNDE